VLEETLELAPEQRSAFLQRNCSSDPSLRQEVETLLASSPDVRSSFLQSSPLRVTLTSGTRLGDYEVKSLLGSGGMGEVYRARVDRTKGTTPTGGGGGSKTPDAAVTVPFHLSPPLKVRRSALLARR
jgi:hypothetical protein